MAEKSADIQTLAPRLSYVEDLAAWLKENTGGGAGGSDPSPLTKRLYSMTVYGAEVGAWSPDPWTVDTVYNGTDKSMHITLFGANADNAVACQDGKGFYGWIFPSNETRWRFGPGQGSSVTLAADIFGYAGDGYLESLRSESQSLCKAIWGDPSELGGSKTIVRRIDDVLDDLDFLSRTVDRKIERLQDNVDDALWDLKTDSNAQFAEIRSRLAAGGL